MSSAVTIDAPQTCVHAEGVTFSYGGPPAVRDVTMDVGAGEFVGLAGPNGAGKSTLLHLLTGYLRANQGGITLDGRDIATMPRREIAQHIAFVPQKSESAFSFSVIEMVLMGRQPYAGLAAFDTLDDFSAARQALADAGIARLADKPFDELSGGEQQLVLIARALAQQTSILLLDEPVTFLDVRHQWDVLNLLERLRAGGRAVLATFHDLNLAARWCTRLVLMREGAVVAEGAPVQVLAPDRLQSIYGLAMRVESTANGRIRVDFPI